MSFNLAQQQHAPVTALTIAGLDPSGGAGIIADIGVFHAFGYSAAAALTSITFQNDEEMSGADHLSPATIRAQVLAVAGRSKVACTKTGMLPTRAIVCEVARLFRKTNLPAPVVDPVAHSTSGHALIEDDALTALLQELLPLARLVTPNIPEAERITGLHIRDLAGMREAAAAIRARGARAVLIKGGHLGAQAFGLPESGKRPTGVRPLARIEFTPTPEGQAPAAPGEAIDLLENEGEVTVFRGEWINGPGLRGTGCMLSAAIASCLGRGMTMEASVSRAKKFVTEAIRAKAAQQRK